MFIKNIQVQKYRHLEGLEFGPFRTPDATSDLIVLAGPNGGGKTSVLELISLALSNMWSLTYQLNRTASQSSFEVTIGLLPEELKLIEQAKEAASSGFSASDARAFEYLVSQRSYCRSFGFQGGAYQKDPTLHNQMHDLVQRILRGSYSRPLGFFLGADRSFVKREFNRNHLFNYSTYATYQHAWSFAFQPAIRQYEDMFDFIVTWRYHFTRRLGSWHLKKANELLAENETPPQDFYGDILNLVFPGYRFVDSESDAPTDLHVRIPSGEAISFSDLSSGEKEVFFMLCFFQRHNVQEAVLLIDEPELHLHPSLARTLLRTMQTLKPRNQIWLATQSSEIIDQAGRDRVFFIRRGENKKADVVKATDEEQSLTCLRDFFGYSGYLGLAKAMVFTEGRNSSADRKLFARLLPAGEREIKFIPASGCSEVERINRAVLSILEADVGWCRFFLIRDRDFMTDEICAAVRQRGGDRLFLLHKHEIENYLIVPRAIAVVLSNLFDVPCSEEDVEQELLLSAKDIAGNVLREMVAFRLNSQFRPEDFSVPKLLQDELPFGSDGWNAQKLATLKSTLSSRASGIRQSLQTEVAKDGFDITFEQCRSEIELALSSDKWKQLLPGKEILQRFARRKNLGNVAILHNAVINHLASNPEYIDDELKSIFQKISD